MSHYITKAMEVAVEQLQRMHPHLDRMMCETLLKLHEQGKLEKFVPQLDETPPQPQHCLLRGGITIEAGDETQQ